MYLPLVPSTRKSSFTHLHNTPNSHINQYPAHLHWHLYLLCAAMQNSRLLTCRYWALGPSCPDGNQCGYAHRDAGYLAIPARQPGTCLNFSTSRRCPRGDRCEYERKSTTFSSTLHSQATALIEVSEAFGERPQSKDSPPVAL